VSKLKGAVLTDSQLEDLRAKKALALPAKYLQPGGFDLPIGTTAYQASCIPSLAQGFDGKNFIKNYCHSTHDLKDGSIVLMPGINYLVKIQCALDLPKTIVGYSNPKSSAGRCDLDCTLLAEGGTEYNVIPAGYKGSLYLLVSAQSFPVILRPGDTLMQIRLFKGVRDILTGVQLKKIHQEDPLVSGTLKPVFTNEGILLHLDLTGAPSNLVSIPNGRRRWIWPSARASILPTTSARNGSNVMAA